MHVDRQGTGPRAFVGIPGWVGRHRTFKNLWPYIPADASFYGMDLPGFGDSPPLEEWSIPCLMSAIEAALDAQKLEKLTIVCHCAGSGPALTLAQRRPAQVRRLVAIDAFPRQPLAAHLLRVPALGEAFHRVAFGNDMGRWISNQLMRGIRRPDTDVTRGLAESDPRVVMRFLPLIMSIAEIRRYAGLPTPIDLVYGEHTFRAVRRGAPEWTRLFPQVRIHCIPGAGHETFYEAPQEVAQVVFGQTEGQTRRHA